MLLSSPADFEYTPATQHVSEVRITKHTSTLPQHTNTDLRIDIPFQTVSKMFRKHEQKGMIYKLILTICTHFISIFYY